MQKNWQRSSLKLSGRPRHYPVDTPNVVSVDDLAVMPDDDLIVRLRSLEEDRQKVIDVLLDPRPWEEEVAYIKRELQIRRARHEAHDLYVKELEREAAASEANLPVADLDNSRFLRLVGEMN